MRRNIFKSFFGLLLVFLTAISVGSSAWLLNKAVVADVNFGVDKVKVGGIVENYRDGQNQPYARFTRLENAVNNANNQPFNVKVVVTYGSVLDVMSGFSIKNGVNVILPFSPDNHEYKSGSMEGTAFSDRNSAQVALFRKTLVRVHNSIIKIEAGGTLSIGGKTGTLGVTGEYTEINLNPYSSIEVAGTLNAYGYIKESDANHGNLEENNTTYNNTFDQYRYIKVTPTGTIDTPLGLYNVPSGGNLDNLNSAGILPINIFQFPNIQTYLTIEAGGKFTVQAKLTVAGISETPAATIVGPKSGNALFYINNGSISFEYCPVDYRYTNNDRSPTRVIINGSAEVGFLSLKVSIVTISTKDKFLPISYKLHVIVNTGTLSTDYKIKFMPGSLLRINDGAIVNNNADIIFYKDGYNDGVQTPAYPTSGYDDAKLINNGRINILSNGKLGAFIETERADKGAIIDLTAVASQSALTVSSNEGTNVRSIVITSTGYFYDDVNNTHTISQFKVGLVVNSLNLGWFGEKYDLVSLSVVFDLSQDYFANAGSYRVYTRPTINGTKTEITGGETARTEEFDVTMGTYVEFELIRVAGATVNGVTITNGYKFQITEDSEAVVHPLEGIAVKIAGSSVSGNASVTYKFTENYNGSNYEVTIKSSTPAGHLILIKDSQFKVSRSGTTRNAKPYYTKSPTGMPPTPTAGGDPFSWNKNYIADANYNIFVFQDAACVGPEALVAMADGTYKESQYVRAGDMVLAMNHEKGIIEAAPIVINDHIDLDPQYHDVLNLHFSNGSVTGIIGEQGYFNVDLNKYVYLNIDNYESFIGHKFYAITSAANPTRETAILTHASIETKYTKVYSPVSYGYFNIIVDNMLSMPGEITGLFNYFEYEPETLAWDADKMARDIAEYGLLSYEDFEEYISYDIFLAINAKYLGVAIGKGILTWELFQEYADKYASNIVV